MGFDGATVSIDRCMLEMMGLFLDVRDSCLV